MESKDRDGGVRRFENEDGSLTDAGKKRYRKEHLREYVDKTDKYMEEYRNSKEGREKFNRYKENRRSTKAHDDYYTSAANYTAKKLLSEYGAIKLSALEHRKGDKSVVEGKKLVDRIVGQLEYNYDFVDESKGRLGGAKRLRLYSSPGVPLYDGNQLRLYSSPGVSFKK